MKKQYTSPYLAIESFQLNGAIAGSCKDAENGHAINHYDTVGDCGWGTADPYFDSETGQVYEYKYQYWNSSNCSSDVTVGDSGDDNDLYCYHAANAGVFTYS